ncbi:MAG: DUF1580 domain-containing protein [Planctomycetota bacterium]
MIDIQAEDVVSLTEAAKSKHLPRRRKGKRPHVATLFRWATVGVRGIVLETIQCGGTRCTSVEALQRFFERCTDPSALPHQSTTKAREREIAKAERELEAAGI